MVYRLRKRSGNVDLVRSAGNAYAIADGVFVDVWHVESLANQILRSKDAQPDLIQEAYDAVQNRSWPHLLTHDWFGLVDFRISECQRTFAKFFIERAQQEGNHTEVLAYAEALIAADECDEWGYRVLVDAYLALGQDLDAARAYRNYRTILKKEFGVEPSDEMRMFATSNAL